MKSTNTSQSYGTKRRPLDEQHVTLCQGVTTDRTTVTQARQSKTLNATFFRGHLEHDPGRRFLKPPLNPAYEFSYYSLSLVQTKNMMYKVRPHRCGRRGIVQP